MSMTTLNSEQQAFLSECELEFANRYSMDDPEFKRIYDTPIPQPPIMNNWYPRSRRGGWQQGYGRRFNERGDSPGSRFNRRERDRSYDRDQDRKYDRDRNNSRDQDRRSDRHGSSSVLDFYEKLIMGYMESINYVLYDNPISQGVTGATKAILKPIVNFANGNNVPQVQIITKTEPLWIMAREPGPFVRIAGLSGALAVSLAAYGAHKKYPKDQITELKAVADSANKMHFFHALALLGAPLSRNPRTTGGLFIAGTILFSGPCYYYAFTGENKFGKLAPIGGTILILGWLSMVL